MSERYDIVIDQGSAFSMTVELYDADNNPDETEYVAASKLKKHYTSTNSYAFTCTVNNSILTLSMTSAYTANTVPGRYMYDVELTAANTTTRILEGVATITPEITK